MDIEKIIVNTKLTVTPITDLAKDVQDLYSTFEKKIASLITTPSINLKTDVNFIRILIENAMTMIENYKSIITGTSLSGPEKQNLVIIFIKNLILSLSSTGKIDPVIANEFNDALDTWAPVVMTIAVDAIKNIFDIGQAFINDAATSGCGTACQKDCKCCTIS